MIGADKDRAIYNKLAKLCTNGKNPECPVCNKKLYLTDATELEYVKTKRGTEIFIHTNCVKHWGDK